MAPVPRIEFVPEKWRARVKDDSPLPIGYGQTISQPSLVDEMTTRLQLQATDRALEIGAGSGYQAAILAERIAEVYAVEIIPQLADEASARLERLGYHNIKVRCGDGFNGWPEYAPFNAIIVSAAIEKLPPPLIEQLAEGGRIIFPKGPASGTQMLILGHKEKGKLRTEELFFVRFVPFTRK
jgi:protein-L-isoaspartate(D-aspartate) O-methyltransferase